MASRPGRRGAGAGIHGGGGRQFMLAIDELHYGKEAVERERLAAENAKKEYARELAKQVEEKNRRKKAEEDLYGADIPHKAGARYGRRRMVEFEEMQETPKIRKQTDSQRNRNLNTSDTNNVNARDPTRDDFSFRSDPPRDNRTPSRPRGRQEMFERRGLMKGISPSRHSMAALRLAAGSSALSVLGQLQYELFQDRHQLGIQLGLDPEYESLLSRKFDRDFEKGGREMNSNRRETHASSIGRGQQQDSLDTWLISFVGSMKKAMSPVKERPPRTPMDMGSKLNSHSQFVSIQKGQ